MRPESIQKRRFGTSPCYPAHLAPGYRVYHEVHRAVTEHVAARVRGDVRKVHGS